MIAGTYGAATLMIMLLVTAEKLIVSLVGVM
jgi:hypothetical protein